MSYVTSRTFCCCIPVRVGVFIIAILGLLIGGAGSVYGIIRIKGSSEDWSSVDKIASGILIGIYALYFFISALGLWGAIAKRRGLIKAFFVMLAIHVVLNIVAGSLALYSYYKNAQVNIDKCISDSNNADSDLIKSTCKHGIQIFNGCMVGLYIFIWLLQIYGCAIVNDYAKQLEEEEYVKAKDSQFNQSMSRA